jgi:hypothetical protein
LHDDDAPSEAWPPRPLADDNTVRCGEGMKRGRKPDPHATRTPSGRKSRSNRARRADLLAQPAGARRLADFHDLGLTGDAAEEAAADPLTATAFGRLRVCRLITYRQWQTGAAIERAWRALAGGHGLALDRRLPEFIRYATFIAAGRQVKQHLDPSADDEEGGPTGRGKAVLAWPGEDGPPQERWRGSAWRGDDEFSRTMREFIARGATPHVFLTVARNVVIGKLGHVAWQLLDALLCSGGPVPCGATLALLRRALDTVDRWQPVPFTGYRYDYGKSVREMPFVNRGPALPAASVSHICSHEVTA